MEYWYNRARLYAVAALLTGLAAPALADFSSACGGDAGHSCDCSDRYICDNQGSCSCQGDQYCADTNCGVNESDNKDALTSRIKRLMSYIKNGTSSGPNSTPQK